MSDPARLARLVPLVALGAFVAIGALPAQESRGDGRANEGADSAIEEGRDEESTIIPDTIVVTAPAPGTAVEPGTTVIDAEEARRAGHETVADALVAEAGIFIQRRGSGFEAATLRIRGSTAEQVLLLRDGRPVTDARGAVSDLSRISLAGVERIEVVRGAATALYGAGAAAGAINVVSASPSPMNEPSPSRRAEEGFVGTTRAGWGSFGEYRLETELTRHGERSAVGLALTGVLSENSYDYERAGESVTHVNAGGAEGGIRLFGASDLEAGRVDGSAPRIDGELSLSRSEREVPGSVEFPSSSAVIEDTTAAFSATVTAPARVRGGAWELGASTGGSFRERLFSDPDYSLGELSGRSQLAHVDAYLSARRVPTGIVELAFPLETRSEWLDDDDLEHRRRAAASLAPSIRLNGRLAGGSDLSGTLRVRGESIADDEELYLLPSARVTGGWSRTIRGAGQLHASVAAGRGYRLPSFSELFWPAEAFAVGNPDLEPELAHTVEISVAFLAGDVFSAEARGHAAWYDALIQWRPDPTGIWSPRNTGQARIVGIEIVSGVSVPVGIGPWNIELDTTAELLDARDRTDGPTFDEQLPYRPRVAGALDMGFVHLLGHRVSASIQAVGARPLTAQNTSWLDPYVGVDISGAFAVPGTSIVVGAAVNNVLDVDYVETRFYPNPGREFVVRAEISW